MLKNKRGTKPKKLLNLVVFKLFYSAVHKKNLKNFVAHLTKKTKLLCFKSENLNLTDVSVSENYEFEMRLGLHIVKSASFHREFQKFSRPFFYFNFC